MKEFKSGDEIASDAMRAELRLRLAELTEPQREFFSRLYPTPIDRLDFSEMKTALDQCARTIITKRRMSELDEIQARVRPLICSTFSSRGETIEGRISKDDFERLIELAAISQNELSCQSAASAAAALQVIKGRFRLARHIISETNEPEAIEFLRRCEGFVDEMLTHDQSAALASMLDEAEKRGAEKAREMAAAIADDEENFGAIGQGIARTIRFQGEF